MKEIFYSKLNVLVTCILFIILVKCSQLIQVTIVPSGEGSNVMEEMMTANDKVYKNMLIVDKVNAREVQNSWVRNIRTKNINLNDHMKQLHFLTHDNESMFYWIVASWETWNISYEYWAETKCLISNWIKNKEDNTYFSGNQYMKENNLIEIEVVNYRYDLLNGIFLRNWFDNARSRYSIDDLGDIELRDIFLYDKAVYHGKVADVPIDYTNSEIVLPQEVIDDSKNEERKYECENYKIQRKVDGESYFKSIKENPFYDDALINQYLNKSGTCEFEVLYADQKFLCIWKINGKGEQEIVLLDLYRTNLREGGLAIGESWEYGFMLPITELEKRVKQGNCKIEMNEMQRIVENPQVYIDSLNHFFKNREYRYRTYIRNGTIGFLIPVEDKNDNYSFRLEIDYDWKQGMDYNEAQYYPEELKMVYEKNFEWIQEQKQIIARNSKEDIQIDMSIYLQNKNMMQTKCIIGDEYGISRYMYFLYDIQTQDEMRIEDVVNIDREFINWIKNSGEVTGNLTKASYSITEGCEQTKEMLKNCPAEKLEEALLESEFYLEPGVIHIKLPYWNYKAEEPDWMPNGTDKIWKNWITIKTEDIEEFLKVEVW